jgi:hypothetical protein
MIVTIEALETADLESRRVGPHSIRMINDRRGQPEHPLLDLAHRAVVSGSAVRLGGREAHDWSVPP